MNFKPSKILTGHAGAIYDVELFDASRCLTTSADKFVARWNLKDGVQDKFSVRLNDSGFRISLINNNQHLVIGNARGGIHIIDLENNKEIRYFTQHNSAVFSITYNPSDNVFYTADAEGYLCVWDATSFELKLTYPLHCGKIRTIALSEDHKYIAVCGQDGYVRIFDTVFMNERFTFKAHESGVNCAIFKGEKLYTGGKNAYISCWKWSDQERIKTIPAHNFAVYDLLFLNEGKQLVSCSFDKTIKVWETDSLEIIERLDLKKGGHKHVVNRLAKLTENSFLSVSDDRQIIVWEQLNER